jgi:hypothetical protein
VRFLTVVIGLRFSTMERMYSLCLMQTTRKGLKQHQKKRQSITPADQYTPVLVCDLMLSTLRFDAKRRPI